MVLFIFEQDELWSVNVWRMAESPFSITLNPRLDICVITKGLIIVGIHFTSIADASHHNLCLFMINMGDERI